MNLANLQNEFVPFLRMDGKKSIRAGLNQVAKLLISYSARGVGRPDEKQAAAETRR